MKSLSLISSSLNDKFNATLSRTRATFENSLKNNY